MHIALLHYAAPPVIGGVERVLAEQAGLLAADGHQVTVVAGRGAAWSPDIAFRLVPRADSRHPEVLAVKAALDRGLVPPAFEALTAALRGELEACLAGVDLVVAHNLGSLHKNLALTAALAQWTDRPGRPPLVLWHHDLAATAARYQAELHSGWPWDLLRSDWAWRHVVVSEARRGELAGILKLPLEAIHVVPNGVWPAAVLGLSAETESLAADLDLTAAAPLVLLPARLTRRKNIELALAALSHLLPVMPQARLLVTGPLGPHNPANQAYLTELLALRDHLGLSAAAHLLAALRPEPLSDRAMADLYCLADAVLFPSFDEGFGLPLLEAALAGRPIFAADIPSLRELGGEAVSWFDPHGPPEALAECIAQRLGADPLYRLSVRVRSAYTWPQVYRQRIAPVLGL